MEPAQSLFQVSKPNSFLFKIMIEYVFDRKVQIIGEQILVELGYGFW